MSRRAADEGLPESDRLPDAPHPRDTERLFGHARRGGRIPRRLSGRAPAAGLAHRRPRGHRQGDARLARRPLRSRQSGPAPARRAAATDLHVDPAASRRPAHLRPVPCGRGRPAARMGRQEQEALHRNPHRRRPQGDRDVPPAPPTRAAGASRSSTAPRTSTGPAPTRSSRSSRSRRRKSLFLIVSHRPGRRDADHPLALPPADAVAALRRRRDRRHRRHGRGRAPGAAEGDRGGGRPRRRLGAGPRCCCWRAPASALPDQMERLLAGLPGRRLARGARARRRHARAGKGSKSSRPCSPSSSTGSTPACGRPRPRAPRRQVLRPLPMYGRRSPPRPARRRRSISTVGRLSCPYSPICPPR